MLSELFLLLIALAATLARGVPVESRGDEVKITFIGAANAQFTKSFPLNGERTKISNVLSISHIESKNAHVSCVFRGIDHSVTRVVGAELVDVGPPQTQVSGHCERLLMKREPEPEPEPIAERGVGPVKITFIGAANAQFTEMFPTNGNTKAITNVLSISHIRSHTADVNCVFNGIDHSVTRTHGAELVDVGPPQTQISGHCKAV